jgi:glucokinase
MNDYYVGIDLGGTRVKIGLIRDEEIIERTMIPANAAKGLAHSLPLIRDALNGLLEKNKLSPASLSGIGLGFPGIVDPEKKKILSTNAKYDDALDIDLEEWFNKYWSGYFFIDNDARVAAVGEWKYGAGKDSDDLVLITIGTGIGTSVITGGKLLRGKHFQAGLGGHFTIDYNGLQCTCGNIGCVEAHASTWSLRERIIHDPAFMHSAMSSVSVIDFETLFLEAEKKDHLAVRMREDCFNVWAAGIVNLIHAYDPELIVVGGGVMNNRDLIISSLTAKVHQHAWTPWGKVTIRASELMEDAGITGAVYCLKYTVK